MKPRRISIDIGHLAIEGLPARERGAFIRAMKAEIARRVAEPGALDGLSQGGRVNELKAGKVVGVDGKAVGARIAATIAGRTSR